MENNLKESENLTQRFVSFIGGRGFYIVLLACLAVIGASSVLIFTENGGGEDYVQEIVTSESIVIPDVPAVTVPEPEPDIPVMDIIEASDAPEELPAVEAEAPAEKPTATELPQRETVTTEAPGETTHRDEAPKAEPLIFIRPVAGEIAVEYAPETLIYNKTMGDWRVHAGIDIETAIGTKVLACANGTVTEVRSDDLLGTVVTIDHGDGLVSLYANLAAVPTVKAGDAVTVSSVIGAVGNTALGESGEVQHLHFAMTKNGSPVDPFDYIPK